VLESLLAGSSSKGLVIDYDRPLMLTETLCIERSSLLPAAPWLFTSLCCTCHLHAGTWCRLVLLVFAPATPSAAVEDLRLSDRDPQQQAETALSRLLQAIQATAGRRANHQYSAAQYQRICL